MPSQLLAWASRTNEPRRDAQNVQNFTQLIARPFCPLLQRALLSRIPIAMSLWNSFETLVDLFVVERLNRPFVSLCM